MRFHIGYSFSLRKLKKFFFPILIGIISYFLGSGFFGFLQVNAATYENYDTSYNITYGEFDFSTRMVDSTHTWQDLFTDLVDYGSNSENYYFIIGISDILPTLTNHTIYFYLIPKNVDSSILNSYSSFFGTYDGSSYYFNNFFLNAIPHYRTSFSFNNNNTFKPFGDDYHSSQSYQRFVGCLTTDSCYWFDNNLNQTGNNIARVQLARGTIGNDFNGVIDYTNQSLFYITNGMSTGWGQILYYSSFPIVFQFNSNNLPSGNVYKKTLKVNDTIYNYGDRVPTYCELYNYCSTSLPTLASYNYLDDLFISNIPVNNYSNLEVKFSYDFYRENYADNFHIQGFYYGRVNNGTYYSYEPLTCSLTGGSSFGNFKSRATYHISNCAGDLSRYDSLIVRLRMSSMELISNFSFTSNLGHINIAPVFNGDNRVEIMDYFGSLPSDFSLVVSSTQDSSYLEYIGDSKYTIAQRINKSNNDISSLANSTLINFGMNTNSNVILYNYTLENNNSTDLYLFFSEGVIVSFSDNGAYTYYDDSNTISTESITIKYLIDVSQYDSSSFIDIIDNFIDELDSSMIDMHIVLNNIYDSLPIFLNYLILVLYTLFLLYLLFKVLKR